MDAEDKVTDAIAGGTGLARNILSLRYIVIISLISIIAYAFLTPSILSGILPFLCSIATLVYPFHPRGSDKDIYKRITTGFIFSVSLLMLFHLVSGRLTARTSEDILIIITSSLIGLVAMVMVVDIFITFEKIGLKFWLRLIPAWLFSTLASLFLFLALGDGNLVGHYRSIFPYVAFLVVIVSGILLAIYAWIDIDREKMNWFYIFCSFVSVVVLPVIMLVATKIITQPVLISSSCHATSALKRRKSMPGRYRENRRRARHLRRLEENGDISRDFYLVMSGLIYKKNRK